MKKKIFKVIVLIAILVVSITACSQTNNDQSQDQEVVSLKVGVFHYMSYSPLFIAESEGYFEEQGLDVELINFGGSSPELLPALFSRELDAVGYTLSAAIINAALQGNNVKYVADKGFINPNNCTTDAWVASKAALESGALAEHATIAGKNVVSFPAGTVEYSLDILLNENNLSQEDLNISMIRDSVARVESLNNGAIDVSMLSEPWITRAEATGAGEVWVPFSDIIPNTSMGLIVFGPSILEDNPEVGVRFLIAYLQGIEQYNQGMTDRNVEIIAEFTQLDPADIKASCSTSFVEDDTVDTESMLAFQEWAFEKGYVDGILELDQLWAPQFIEEAFEKIDE